MTLVRLWPKALLVTSNMCYILLVAMVLGGETSYMACGAPLVAAARTPARPVGSAHARGGGSLFFVFVYLLLLFYFLFRFILY